MSSTYVEPVEAKRERPQRPYRVLVVTGVYPTEERPHKGTFIKSQVDSLLAEGLEVEVIHPKPGPTLLRYVVAALQVLRKTQTGKFDIVHGHYGQWCMIARLQWTTPVVTSFMGDDLLGTITPDGGYSKVSRVIVRLSRWLSRHVDAVIVKSEGMKKVVPSGANVYVIPNGVDFERFHPIPRAEARAALGWDQDRYYVLFCNDPEIPVKNFSLARAAIQRLHDMDIPAELVVASGIAHEQVVLYMNASNALILPSIAEGSPNVVKEAMACNIPVVASNVGDVAEVIGHTRGCYVCPLEAEAFAAALAAAFQHPGPTTGRDDIAHLENSLIAKRLLTVYDQLLSKKVKNRQSSPTGERKPLKGGGELL